MRDKPFRNERCSHMTSPAQTTQTAWQPLTPRGVAAFAHARLDRLLVVQFLVALLTAVAAVWLSHVAYLPTVRDAISRLPAQGEIHAGKLDWHGDSPQRLAAGSFLSFAVDLDHTGQVRSPAHVQIEFGRTTFLAIALFGQCEMAYPAGWIISFNRTELKPWWGAWEPPLIGMSALAMLAGLMVSWALLATLYAFPAWLFGFFANRDLRFRSSWKLAGAALMPGTLLLIGALVLYGMRFIDLAGLAFLAAAHVVLGWIYLFVSAWYVSRHPGDVSVRKNPFAAAHPESNRTSPH
jgi:hypothetical protein